MIRRNVTYDRLSFLIPTIPNPVYIQDGENVVVKNKDGVVEYVLKDASQEQMREIQKKCGVINFDTWWEKGHNPDEISWEQMLELLDAVNFSLESCETPNGRNVYWLRDCEGVNLDNIEENIFAVQEKKPDEVEKEEIKRKIIDRILLYLEAIF